MDRDRRVFRRIEVDVLIKCDNSGWAELSACDISAGGMRFATGIPFQVGDAVRLQVIIRNHKKHINNTHCLLVSKVVRLDKCNDQVMVAVKFETDKEITQHLDKVIRSIYTCFKHKTENLVIAAV